jgi:hypothetical protein
VRARVVVGPSAEVFGYTIVDDVSSRDPWLDGDQWLLGKSMAGFCPVGPWIVTADELDPAALRLGCQVNGTPIQDVDRPAAVRHRRDPRVPQPPRPAPSRRPDRDRDARSPRRPHRPRRPPLAGDVVTCWIEDRQAHDDDRLT